MGKQKKQWVFILWGSKSTADGDCSHEIKRCLLLERKAMTHLDSILKRHYFANKCGIIKAMFFPVTGLNWTEINSLNKYAPTSGPLYLLIPLSRMALPLDIYIHSLTNLPKMASFSHPPYSDLFYFTEYITIWHYIFLCCCHPSLEWGQGPCLVYCWNPST